LIAVILLIAFTLVVAGILAGWATNFAREQRTSIEQCMDARVIIHSATYDSSADDITLYVYNNGKIPLRFKTMLSFANGSLIIDENTQDTEVAAGKVQEFTIANQDFAGLTEITVQSITCFGAQDFIEARNINNIEDA